MVQQFQGGIGGPSLIFTVWSWVTWWTQQQQCLYYKYRVKFLWRWGNPNWSITVQCSKETLELLGQKGSRTSYSKDHFNGPKYSEQLSVHSCKRKKKEKIWQNSSHLEFHSIFNQDGITNSPKNLQFQRAKRVKLAHLLRSLKTCSSVTENILNI